MDEGNKDREEPTGTEGTEEKHWSEYEQAGSSISLDKTDYVALFIASLETIFLPLIMAIAVFVAIALAFRFLI